MIELRGVSVANWILDGCRVDIKKLSNENVVLTLSIIRIGSREDDLAYERGIIKRFEKMEARVLTQVFEENVSEDVLLAHISSLNNDNSIHGILMFAPLPKHLNEEKIKESINPNKDVDGMTEVNMAKVYKGDIDGYSPCTAGAVMKMLEFYEYNIRGAKVAILGRSLVVGRPLSMLMLKQDATVTMLHTKTKEIEIECRRADIIIACCGRAGLVNNDYVREGQVIIDVGINIVENRLIGDVDMDSVSDIVNALSPVPGGVGSVTTAVLFENCVRSAMRSIVNK